METLGKYKVHPLATLFPDATPEEDAGLEASISTHGLLDHGGLGAVILFQRKVLDGRCLLDTCAKLGVEPRFVTLPDDADANPLAVLLAANVHRRTLSESQRAVVAYLLWSRFGSGAPAAGEGDCVILRSLTQEKCADLLRVSRSLVTHAGRVLSPDSPAVPELRRAVELGQVRITDASSMLTQPAEVQRQATAMVVVVDDKAQTVTRAVQQVNREAVSREDAENLATNLALSLGDPLTLHTASAGDMQILVTRAAVDAIITHPLPRKGTLDLLDDLAVFAEHALRDTGALIVVGSGLLLPEMLERLSQTGLQWVGAFVIVFPEPSGSSGPPHNIQLRHRPVLVYGKPAFRFQGGEDLIEVPPSEGKLSLLSQDEVAMEMLVQRFTHPGQTVCDPLMLDQAGVALGARQNGCNFIGASEFQTGRDWVQQRLEQEEIPSEESTQPLAVGATNVDQETGEVGSGDRDVTPPGAAAGHLESGPGD